jgi:DNA-binding NarL/FixJ family response regulator
LQAGPTCSWAPDVSARRVEVALVEDDPGTRDRLARAIAGSADLDLRFAASTASELLAWLPEHPVEVLLVDIGLPDRSGIEVVRQALAWHPVCEVMIVTMFGDESSMLQAFEAGARGYLLKDGTEDDLARHVRSLRAGGSPMSPVIARRLLDRMQRGAIAAPAAGIIATAAPRGAPTGGRLSQRESDVLDLVSRGFTYQEVAKQLAISLATVQTHARNIYGKLAVHSKTEAVYEARQLGLLP